MSTDQSDQQPSLEIALRRLGIVYRSGHCGEENSEIKSRDRHNEAVDVVFAALKLAAPATVQGRYEHAAQEAASQAATDRANWPPFNSAHEGFAVLLEEVDELKAHVWTNQKRRDLAAMRKEALQVAAVAIAFAADCCDEKRGRK